MKRKSTEKKSPFPPQLLKSSVQNIFLLQQFNICTTCPWFVSGWWPRKNLHVFCTDFLGRNFGIILLEKSAEFCGYRFSWPYRQLFSLAGIFYWWDKYTHLFYSPHTLGYRHWEDVADPCSLWWLPAGILTGRLSNAFWKGEIMEHRPGIHQC